MAIQVWDDATQQYRGVELARYGPSGTLAEALVWVNGAYKRVWPTGPTVPTPLWTDDFTGPTLHERWTMMGGAYTPPGMHGGATGPIVSTGCELTATASGAAQVTLGAVDMGVFQGVWAQWSPVGGLATFVDLASSESRAVEVSPDATVTIRRSGGEWSLLINGELGTADGVDAVLPDTYTIDLPLFVGGGSPTAPITSVSYTEL